MSKYQNLCKFLEPLFKVVSTKEDLDKNGFIFFHCEKGHENKLTSASITNKKSKVPLDKFCSVCVKAEEIEIKRIEFMETVREKTGHIVLSVDFTSRFVEYQCGNCDNISNSKTNNLLNANTGLCHSCQNDKFKLTYEYVKKTVEEHGMTLLLNPGEYKNNKQLLPLLCKCGSPYQAVLSDIKGGYHCQKCKKEKYKQTCIEKYGVENAFQSEIIKQKIKETSMKKYGFEHAMRHPDIIRKSVSSSYKKVVYTLPSGDKVDLMGYEPIALEELYKEGFTEEEITLKDVPHFFYKDQNGKQRTYIPDMYIPHLHMIIEIKSSFTEEQKKDNNQEKQDQVLKDGFFFRKMIYDHKGTVKVSDVTYSP